MNSLDLVIILVIGYHAIKGSQKGLVVLIFELLTILLSLAVSFRYYPQLKELIEKHLSLNMATSNILSFCLIFLLIMLALKALQHLINTLVSLSGLGIVNRIGGLIGGIMKGVFYLCFVITPLLFLNLSVVQQSILIPPLLPIINVMAEKMSPVDPIPKPP